jgi:hypothetical protein
MDKKQLMPPVPLPNYDSYSQGNNSSDEYDSQLHTPTPTNAKEMILSNRRMMKLPAVRPVPIPVPAAVNKMGENTGIELKRRKN